MQQLTSLFPSLHTAMTGSLSKVSLALVLLASVAQAQGGSGSDFTIPASGGGAGGGVAPFGVPATSPAATNAAGAAVSTAAASLVTTFSAPGGVTVTVPGGGTVTVSAETAGAIAAALGGNGAQLATILQESGIEAGLSSHLAKSLSDVNRMSRPSLMRLSSLQGAILAFNSAIATGPANPPAVMAGVRHALMTISRAAGAS